MINYIVYLKSGQILKTGICDEDSFLLQGEHVLEGIADDAKQYIKDEKVVDLPPKPDGYYNFNYGLEIWEPDTEQQLVYIRKQRNQLLQSSDWTQLPDVPLSTKEAWAVYRQALRDVTNQPDPFNITWPQPPN